MTALKHDIKPPDEWKASVHAKALADGDSSAPTCSTCHSGHGPTPTGVASLELVCAQCHVRESDLYNSSPKKKLFEDLDHPGCITCHENHKIVKPSDNWVSMKDPASPCTTCHDSTVKGAAEIVTVRQQLQQLSDGIDRAGQILDRAERVGMLVDDGRAAVREARAPDPGAPQCPCVCDQAVCANRHPGDCCRVARRTDWLRRARRAPVPPQGPGRRDRPHPGVSRDALVENPAPAARCELITSSADRYLVPRIILRIHRLELDRSLPVEQDCRPRPLPAPEYDR